MLNRTLLRTTILGLAVTVLVLAPVSVDFDDGPLTFATAAAKGGGGGGGGGAGGGNGGGHGGGNGGGHGGGHGGGQGHGASAAAHGDGPGNGRGGGSKGQAQSDGVGKGKGQGSMASKLGSLNAAHASETARANAAPNSRVGQIAAYEQATLAAREAENDEAMIALEEAAAEALAAASNKNNSDDPAVVAAVNGLLGIADEAEGEEGGAAAAE